MYIVKWYKHPHIQEAYYVREEVFVKEQGFSDEYDDIDKTCHHLVIYDAEKAIACGRAFLYKDNMCKLGRIAVLKEYRGKNIGILIMKEMEKKVLEMGANTVQLSAQCQAKGFYEKAGYSAIGNIYNDQHCPHIDMVKKLKEQNK